MASQAVRSQTSRAQPGTRRDPLSWRSPNVGFDPDQTCGVLDVIVDTDQDSADNSATKASVSLSESCSTSSSTRQSTKRLRATNAHHRLVHGSLQVPVIGLYRLVLAAAG